MKKYLSLAMCLVLVGACMCLVGCGTNYNYDASGFSVGETELTSAPDNIYIDWLGGSVKVEYHAADTVTLAESGAKNDDMRLRWKLTDDNSLFVKYCAPRSRVVVGVGKKLTLTLPENFRATNIEFDTVAASVTTAVLSVQKIKANTVSGNVLLWVANTQSVTVDTVSGRIDVVQNGTADTIDVDTTSGTVAIQADNAKSVSVDTTSGSVSVAAKQSDKISVDTTSGSVSLQIPQEVGFVATFATLSGKASGEAAYAVQDGKYVYGGGKTQISVNTVSGNLNLLAYVG